MLATFFHNDHDSFAATSEVLPGVERSFRSFSAAANEASVSRIYAGRHFRFDEVAGQRLGRRIADSVLETIQRAASRRIAEAVRIRIARRIARQPRRWT